ncbi:MAG: GxxExxY protein [Minisyncoccia bacterium]|jgi:GxxExxY protein
MNKKIKSLIEKVKECAKEVYKELGSGWLESIYQNAMEIALREKGINYESQRIIPISFKGYTIGESKPDLVVWLKSKNKRIAIVIDLKWEPYIKEDHTAQVKKYIKELKKQVKSDEEVFDTGFIINFVKAKGGKVDEEIENLEGVQILNVKI